MDIDRNKINEMKSECLQMPDYIRDMIEETVEQQLKKKQRYGKKMWRVAAAILAFACVGGGTTLAATKLYKMHLEQQGKYGSTLIYGEATNTDATDTDAEVNQNALYTLDVSYVPEGMKVDGLDDIYADGNNYVKKVVLFPEDSSFIGGVSFWFLKMPADQQVSLDETHVISTKELDIDKLLCVSDVCISDYSSLIFEYSLFERPMIFFAYDLDEYFDWRGFYYNYDELTPGPIVKTTEEIIDYIQHLDTRFNPSQVRAFREKFMSACDGHATDRILELVEKC